MNGTGTTEPKRAKPKRSLNPWLVVSIVSTAFAALLALGTFFGTGNPLPSNLKEGELLSKTQISLLETIEAGKNSVLATTDEASIDFAERARLAASKVEINRKELEALIVRSEFARDKELMRKFNECWSQFTSLHNVILDLAVQNTNLKAQRISSTQCAQELKQFEAGIREIIESGSTENQSGESIKLSYEALIAAFKILALHKPHIEETQDNEMDRIEAEMKSYDEAARRALTALHIIPALAKEESLRNSEAAYDRFMLQTAEVLRLSRMNTNIKSTELSWGKQRAVTAQCEDILASLDENIQSRLVTGSR